MQATDGLLSWIEIDAAAFAQNVRALRSLLPEGTRLLVVVKANGYGHGTAPMTELAQRERVDMLGVHAIEEAHEVRDTGWSGPILVMGYVARSRLEEIVRLDVEPTLFDPDMFDALDAAASALGRRIRCHLKVETGTHRQGVFPEDVPAFLDRFRASQHLELAGLSTHFANIEDTTDHGYARAQLERFRRTSDAVTEAGFPEAVRHTACSAAVLTMPETAFGMVRLGIGAYGYWPSRETLASYRSLGRNEVELSPLLSWRTRITQIKMVASGSYIGYGCTERVRRATRLAVLPIGYADGYDRGLSRVAHVLVRGRRAPVLGRVCMNVTMIDVTDVIAAALEDPVTLLGTDGDETIDADDLAGWTQTISYEVVSRLARSIPRFVRE